MATYNFQDNNKLNYTYTNLATRYVFPGYSGANAQVQRVELKGRTSGTEPIGAYDAIAGATLTEETRYGVATRPSIGATSCPIVTITRVHQPT